MEIHEQIIKILQGKEGKTLSKKYIEEKLIKKYKTNNGSILLSDRCYNRFNSGLENDFSKRVHLFKYVKRATYTYLGKDYKYTGKIFHKPKKQKGNKKEFVVGEWKAGELYMNNKQIKKILSEKESSKIDNKKPFKPKLELEKYHPKKVVDLEDLKEIQKEIDYIENHRKLMEIGALAEKIVLENEIEFLKQEYPKLAEKVRLVSNDPKLGFDVLSFETNGKQKQIEVKAISVNTNAKSFILTRNELSKSKSYSNYYVYCVTEINTSKPTILRIKNPDFNNSTDFQMEPLTYKISFE